MYNSIYKLRDQEALRVAGYKLEELRYKSRETYNQIKKKYPIRVAEPTEAYRVFKRLIATQHK
ncbi:MAG: hypothetical protein JKY52_11185 [Flavobacteriales bacterium]|nr:hypothetical protein [Flavobacteriales bacterium]